MKKILGKLLKNNNKKSNNKLWTHIFHMCSHLTMRLALICKKLIFFFKYLESPFILKGKQNKKENLM